MHIEIKKNDTLNTDRQTDGQPVLLLSYRYLRSSYCSKRWQFLKELYLTIDIHSLKYSIWSSALDIWILRVEALSCRHYCLLTTSWQLSCTLLIWHSMLSSLKLPPSSCWPTTGERRPQTGNHEWWSRRRWQSFRHLSATLTTGLRLLAGDGKFKAVIILLWH